MIEYLLGVGLYVPMGLLAARRTKFAMENHVDRRNALATQQRAAWEADKKACRKDNHPYPCHYEYGGAQKTTTRQRWGDGRVGYPLFGGVLWPLALIGVTGFYTYKGAAVASGPFFRWFFQNPKHRKTPQARRIA